MNIEIELWSKIAREALSSFGPHVERTHAFQVRHHRHDRFKVSPALKAAA